MNEETLRIRRVEVTGLFGLYNHKIDLNLQERVTIIHGPNGVGKTMLLKLVAALFSGRLVELARTHFSTFTVTLTDASILGFEREEREFVDEEGVESDQPRQQYLFERYSGIRDRRWQKRRGRVGCVTQ